MEPTLNCSPARQQGDGFGLLPKVRASRGKSTLLTSEFHGRVKIACSLGDGLTAERGEKLATYFFQLRAPPAFRQSGYSVQ
jgi:hypothetical protein